MGTAKVTLIRDEEGRRVIEKSPVSEVEYAFYHAAAPRLGLAGVASPALLSADAPLRRLRLEYIPHPVDQDAVASDEVLSMLARLHDYPPDPSWTCHPHGWSAAALEASLALLALPERAVQQMRCFHQHSEALFRHPGLISGDSNAGNWGRRDNGEWALHGPVIPTGGQPPRLRHPSRCWPCRIMQRSRCAVFISTARRCFVIRA